MLGYIGSLRNLSDIYGIRYIRRELVLFCTMGTENFIRFIRLFDITESDMFEFYYTLLVMSWVFGGRC